MMKKTLQIKTLLAGLLLLSFVAACNSKDVASEGEQEGNIPIYDISSKINIADGISESEMQDSHPLEIKTASELMVYYKAELTDGTGDVKATVSGSGKTGTDGILIPSVQWGLTYSQLVCGLYTVKLTLYGDDQYTKEHKVYTLTGSKPCPQKPYSCGDLTSLTQGGAFSYTAGGATYNAKVRVSELVDAQNVSCSQVCSNYGGVPNSPTITDSNEKNEFVDNSRNALFGTTSMPASCTTEGYGVYGLSGTGGTWVIIPAAYSHYPNRLGASYSHGLSLTSAGSFPVTGYVVCACNN